MCVVTVDRAIATQVNGSIVEKFRIFGTVLDCPPIPPTPGRFFESWVTVTTTLLINGQPDPNQSTTNTVEIPFVGSNVLQDWDLTPKSFPAIPCDSAIRVRAECETDPTCFFEQDFIISCDCPRVTLSASEPNCTEDGTSTVTFTIDLTNLPVDGPVVGTLHLGSGVPGSGVLSVLFDPAAPGPEWSAQGDGFVGTFPFDYQPGIYNDVSFEMTFPGTCRVTVPLTNGPLDIGDCVATNCPNDSDVVLEVIDANNPPFPVPVGPDDPCLPAGDYIVTVTQPTPTTGRDYTWFVDEQEATGPNDNGWNRNSFRHTITAGSAPSISVEVSTPNCESPARSEPVVLRACGDQPPPPPPPPPQPPDWCLIWFWINIILMVITGGVILITFCMIEATVWSAIAALATGGALSAVWAALTTANIVMLIISAFLVVVTLASYILWFVFCAPGRADACSLIQTLIDILSLLVAGSIIVGIVALLASRWGCAVGGFVDVGWFGILLGIAWWVGRAMGCRLRGAN